MSVAIHGIVHGNIIELKEPSGVLDGQEVEVLVRVVRPAQVPGEGILRSAGALADDLYWDGIMAEIQTERKFERRPRPQDL